MVAEVGIHDDDVVAGRELEAVDVGRSQTEFACSGVQQDVVRAVVLLELFGDVQGAVGAAVVDDDDFPV